jgi:hypothetical protein
MRVNGDGNRLMSAVDRRSVVVGYTKTVRTGDQMKELIPLTVITFILLIGSFRELKKSNDEFVSGASVGLIFFYLIIFIGSLGVILFL